MKEGLNRAIKESRINTMGSGCGTVGKVVARGHGFQSGHRRFFSDQRLLMIYDCKMTKSNIRIRLFKNMNFLYIDGQANLINTQGAIVICNSIIM